MINLEDPLHLFLLSTILLIAATSLVMKARRKIWIKVSVLSLAFLILPIIGMAYLNLLGRPKPVNQEFFKKSSGDPEIIAYLFDEKVAIYLYLLFPKKREPMSYRLPWSLKQSKQLQELSRKGKKTGRKIRLRWPIYEETLDKKQPLFYLLPQKALPPKKVPDKPIIFDPKNSDKKNE